MNEALILWLHYKYTLEHYPAKDGAERVDNIVFQCVLYVPHFFSCFASWDAVKKLVTVKKGVLAAVDIIGQPETYSTETTTCTEEQSFAQLLW